MNVSTHSSTGSPSVGVCPANHCRKVRGANVGALAADSGRYVAANEYACELIGYERSELIGRPVGEISLQRGSGVTALRCKDGGEIKVRYRAVEATLSGLPVMLGLFWPV